MPSNDLLAHVKDIQPSLPHPTLELRFDRAHFVDLPTGKLVPITLVIAKKEWTGTMRNDGPSSSNPPYCHTNFSSGPDCASMTEILERLRCDDGAKLLFRKLTHRPLRLRLNRILAKGTPRKRKSAAEPKRRGSASLSTPRASPSRRGFPFGDRKKILRLAEEYWTLITPREAEVERRVESEIPAARRRRYLSKGLFVRITMWKSPRNKKRYLSNPPVAVRRATRQGFRASDATAAIRALSVLDGVALRTASALLHWMRPREFPVADFRVVDALGWAEPSNWNDLGFYERLATRVREIATDNRLDLRTVDRALWAWSKKRSVS